jgi:DnaJ domain
MSLNDQFYGQDRLVPVRGCDCPGCLAPGEHRAPRDRSLNGYFFFCLEHVREYNRNWDYFSGMSGGDIEHYIRDAVVWERPTWPLGQWHMREQQVRDEVMREFFADEMPPVSPVPSMPKAARDALAELELQPPVDFVTIKAQYRTLVKLHHPDANGGSLEAEEKFKSINQAFAILKQFFGEDTSL